MLSILQKETSPFVSCVQVYKLSHDLFVYLHFVNSKTEYQYILPTFIKLNLLLNLRNNASTYISDI